jgi:oxygen-dependent protoporphyrinogen oxidase
MEQTEVTVIGAGITGLSTAYWLKRKGVHVHVVETDNRVGGQIQTQRFKHYIFETGPSTGAVSTPEVAELMNDLAITSEGRCQLETAPDAAKRRLIWKGKRFYDLPSGLFSGITTPLFRFSDKLRILGEPWRKRGNNPNESIASLTVRRLGKSFLDYAVDPFISGVYAGNPDKLVVRFALPKLYALEQGYGSFIRGSIAKMKEPKTERDRLATKKVFSAQGGLSQITQAEADYIGKENISLGVKDVRINPEGNGWITTFIGADGQVQQLQSQWVITTCGAYNLPELLPFVDKKRMDDIAKLVYAPIIEVNVGMPDTFGGDYCAFGGLVPTKERQKLLGILFPSACFTQRAPKGGALFSFFLGGSKHPEMMEKSDDEIKDIVTEGLHAMLKFPSEAKPDFFNISRHQYAIPQYEVDSEQRLSAVSSIERQYSGLIIGGNLRDGIGMGHRITQAANMVKRIIKPE